MRILFRENPWTRRLRSPKAGDALHGWLPRLYNGAVGMGDARWREVSRDHREQNANCQRRSIARKRDRKVRMHAQATGHLPAPWSDGKHSFSASLDPISCRSAASKNNASVSGSYADAAACLV